MYKIVMVREASEGIDFDVEFDDVVKAFRATTALIEDLNKTPENLHGQALIDAFYAVSDVIGPIAVKKGRLVGEVQRGARILITNHELI